MPSITSFCYWICRHLPCWLMLLGPSVQALVVRSYNDADHKRFDPFPSNPQINPASIYSGVNLTGVGFKVAPYTAQCALVSRQHVVYCRHVALISNATVRFVNAAGGLVDRMTGQPILIKENGVDSDLVVYQLNSPIDAGAGIAPMPYFDGNPVGQGIGVLGAYNVLYNVTSNTDDRWLAMGSGVVAQVQSGLFDVRNNGLIMSKVFTFDYNTSPGPKGKTPDDCYLESGDSGGPSFVPVNGKAALIGVHSAVGTQLVGSTVNYDTLVPYYVTQLDAVLNPMGYRMTPVGAAATTLASSTSVVQPVPRRALPLDVVYQVQNTGAVLTGNVELEFQFNPAEAPDSITGPAGWVAYGSGSKWTLRKATLAAAALSSVTAHWASAPSTAMLSFTVVRRSDTTADSAATVDVVLAGSYAEWAAGLADDGLAQDPDADGLINLHEYAFGGEPMVASRVMTGDAGSPLTGSIGVDAGVVSFTYPERSDRVERGLGYTLGFSHDLVSWSATPPDGFSSSVEAYDPVIDGFSRRRCSWPATGPAPLFLKVDVSLNE